MGINTLEWLKATRLAFVLRSLKEKSRYFKITKTDAFYYSCQKLKQYQGIHRGERCFIVATGPSLTISDVNALKNEYTFGVNTCYKLFDKSTWRPTYYCISDINVYKEIGIQLKRMPLKNVFYEGTFPDFEHENGVPFYQFLYYEFWSIVNGNRKNERRFSTDVSKVVYGGASVVYIALQIAVTMGFSEIYLIGVDCNYSGKQRHSQLADYQKQPKLAPDAETNMIRCFEKAKEIAEQNGTIVYNATRGGKLEVFQRVNLDEVLNIPNGVLDRKR